MKQINFPVLIGPARGHRLPVAPTALRTAARYAMGGYESAVARFLANVLPVADVFYDVGAETGYFTRLACRVMGVGGRVLAFEPDPGKLGRLRQVKGAVVLPVAVGAADGDGELLVKAGVCSRLQGMSRPLESQEDGRVLVKVRSIDSLADELPAPNVMKVDVEGAELEVLRGAVRTLGSVRALVVECHSMPLFHDVLGVVLGQQFERVEVTRGGDGVGPPTVLAARLASGDRGD